MKIGVDARNLVNNVTGISRYVLETCRALSSLGNEIILYMPEKPKVPISIIAGAATRISNYPGAVRRMVWGQTELPRRAKRDRLDIFWGPGHRLPFFLDREIPRVVTIHDLVWHQAASTMRLQSWLGDRYLMRPAVNGADLVVAVSKATRRSLEIKFPSAESKLRVVYPGFTSLPSTASISLLGQRKIVGPFALFVGTLEPRKNLFRLLEAYARLPHHTKEKLLLVIAGGSGWHLEDLSSEISRLKIDQFVRLTGYIADEDLALLYRAARFLVMPSLYEGFGFPIIEANAVGTPAIVSNSSSMPEVAGDAALFVDPLDIGSISNALNELANDDALLSELASKAKANAHRFNWHDSASQLSAIFAEAIVRRRGHR